MAILVLAALVLSVDATVLYLAVPALTADLRPSADQILWMGDVYPLALAGLLIGFGALADRVGRRRMLLIGSIGFGLASLLAAFAPTPELLIAARAALGVSGAMIMPSTLSIIRDLFDDPRERTRAIAIWSAGTGGGAALGPIIGGALLQQFWWGAVFLINVPIMLLVVILGRLLLPESKNPSPGRFDLGSTLLSFAMLVPIVWAVKRFVAAGPDFAAFSVLALGILAGWWFVRRQLRSVDPMIDVGLFRSPAFAGTVIANFTAAFALAGLLFFFSQYLQLVRGMPPVVAGAAEVPATVGGLLGIALVGWLLARLGTGRAVAVALVVVALGLALVAVAEQSEHYLWLGLALAVLGFGVGVTQTVTTDAVVTMAPKRKAGAAAALSETSLELGTAFGIAVLGSVVGTCYRAFAPSPPGMSGADRATVLESPARALHLLPSDGDAAEAVRQAFTHAMQLTSLGAAALVLVVALIAWRTIPATREP
ncbi:MFS transporter [Leucobacter iarius]|uniref:MFS transporter n=1 Tax=Leucobacter iarius TaxID=333963 RepID=A0ABN2LAD0_9MICO